MAISQGMQKSEFEKKCKNAKGSYNNLGNTNCVFNVSQIVGGDINQCGMHCAMTFNNDKNISSSKTGNGQACYCYLN
jgi:hypothetical protein